MSSEEYLQRLNTPFKPPTHTLSQLHAAIPKHLYDKSTTKSLNYVFRDISLAVLFAYASTRLDDLAETLFQIFACGVFPVRAHPVGVGNTTAGFLYSVSSSENFVSPTAPATSIVSTLIMEKIFRWSLWVIYWVSQSLVLTGMWCLAHEAGHGTLSPHQYINSIIGFIMHSVQLVPYYSWRATHHAHHRATASVERDENYVPFTRSSLRLPPKSTAHLSDYHDIFEETPIYSLLRIVVMQLLGWQAYLCWNALGSPMYPKGTNHFNPSSKLFKPKERLYVHISNIGLVAMIVILFLLFRPYGVTAFVKQYFVPYLLSNHWIVMLTYLHHTDPSIPHYQKDEWSFLRGACATVDRPLLGWVGRFLFHNVSHDHVAHHHFPMIPFYNQPQVTKIIKPILGHSYNYDSTNSFYALYRSFTECQFIEDDEPIAFYKNKDGVAQRPLSYGGSVKLKQP